MKVLLTSVVLAGIGLASGLSAGIAYGTAASPERPPGPEVSQVPHTPVPQSQVPHLLCGPIVEDRDSDGLDDDCELQLARRFAPLFIASPAACNWNADLGHLEGGYLFAVGEVVRSGTGGLARVIRIVYLPAYFDDCGWSGPKCWIRLRGGCRPHVGDSEAVVVEVIADSPPNSALVPGRSSGMDGVSVAAVVTSVFLSAHCFGSSEGGCRWFGPEELDWDEGSPVLWIAEGKNAAYPTKSHCDEGHMFYDTCDRNDERFTFPVLSNKQNIGRVGAPFPYLDDSNGCIAAADLSFGSGGRTGVECLWSDERFRGWSESAEGVTPYARYLTEVAGIGGS